MYAKPQVGAKLVGQVQTISQGSSEEQATIVCQIEAQLTAIVTQINTERFVLKKEETTNNEE